MTKGIGLSLFLTLTLSLLLATNVDAKTIDWQITWNEDGTIEERVVTSDQELSATLKHWGFVPSREDWSYSRHAPDWLAYNQLEGKLPVSFATRNWVIFSGITFAIDEDATSILDKLENKVMNLQLTVPGFYFKNSGTKVSDFSTVWELGTGEEISLAKPYFTKFIIFNGFALGLFIILAGILGIAIVFIKAIRRVNRLIEEEYSIENYLAQLEEAKENES